MQSSTPANREHSIVSEYSSLIDRLTGWTGANPETKARLLRSFVEVISPRSTIANAITLFMLVAITWHEIGGWPLLLWAALACVPGVAARLYAVRVREADAYDVDTDRKAFWFLIINLGYGLTAGLGGLLFFPEAGGFSFGVMLFVVTFLVVIGHYAAMPGCMRARMLGVFVPAGIGILLRGDPWVIAAAVPIGIWLFLRTDITSRYHLDLRRQFELQATLEKREGELVHANAVKDRFLATMSHELRTPLNGVLGMAQLLRDETGAPGMRERLEIIETAGRDLQALVDDTLYIARSGAVPDDSEPQAIELRALLRETVRLIESGAGPDGAPLTLDIDPAVPPHIAGDRARLRRVLLNLLSNAQKFGQGRPVLLKVVADGARLSFSVQDQGVGIPKQDQDRIFETYTQLDNQPPGTRGAGLGLAITRQLLREMGGEIAVHSDGRQGTRFTFELDMPACAPPEEDTAALPESTATRPLKILLVEDLAMNRAVARAFLERDGHAVRIAETGQRALDLAGAEGFDLILLDIDLPDLDGVEVARRLRRQPRQRAATIVALTAYVFPEDIERYGEAGMPIVLEKPLDQGKLQRVLRQVGGAPSVAPEPREDSREDEDVDLEFLAREQEILGLETLKAVREAFAAELPELLSSVDAALAARDRDGGGRAVHQLASAAGNLGLNGVRRSASHLAQKVRSDDWHEAQAARTDLDEAIDRALASCDAYLATSQANPSGSAERSTLAGKT